MMSRPAEDARLAWRLAQADLKTALDELETRVAEAADTTTLEAARALATARQAEADNLLQRYITHIGKGQDE